MRHEQGRHLRPQLGQAARSLDQDRLCERAARRSRKHYTDHGISGASLRGGIQALCAMRRSPRCGAHRILDRISRDQEDIAGVWRLRCRRAWSRSQADAELHIGFKGTMGALYLKDLADKTRRGLRGRVSAGKSGGGNSYGYDVVTKFTDPASRSVATAGSAAKPKPSAISSMSTPPASRPRPSPMPSTAKRCGAAGEGMGTVHHQRQLAARRRHSQ